MILVADCCNVECLIWSVHISALWRTAQCGCRTAWMNVSRQWLQSQHPSFSHAEMRQDIYSYANVYCQHWLERPTPAVKEDKQQIRLERKGAERRLPWQVTSRVRTRSLLLPTRIMGVWGWVSLRRRRSWAVRWKLRLSVTENTRTHTSHCRADRSWQMSRRRKSEQEELWQEEASCTAAKYANTCSSLFFFLAEILQGWSLIMWESSGKKTSCHFNPQLPTEKPQNTIREPAKEESRMWIFW